MPGLRETTAKLARYRSQFEKLLAATAKAESLARRPPARSPDLKEITGFGSNPGNLRMQTYVPEGLAAGAPLVVVLHGCTQTAEGYDAGAGWSTLAERYSFAVLLPEQQRANNANTCFNWFLPGDIARGKGEALSIRQMIEHMVSDERLDASRVYVTGLSAGGAMAAVMLANYPEVFAGGAIIAGLPYGIAGNVQEALDGMFQGKVLPAKAWGDRVRRASRHGGAWPRISIWHGDADSTVKPVNGEELIKQWTDIHGLSERPSRVESVDGHSRRVWLSADGTPLVEAYTIAGMAHGTPIAAGDAETNCGTAGPFILEAGISSSYRIAEFWGLTGKRRARVESTRRDLTPAQAPSNGFAHPAPISADAGAESRPRPVQPPAGRPAQASPPSASAARGLDPQAVITKALRRAGLLRS